MKRTGTTERSLVPARFLIVISVVFAIACSLYLVWSQHSQRLFVEDKALAEARTLNAEMLSAWEYINDVQPSINHNADGTYDFKGIYCALAGKNIGARFSQKASGYTIRYVREDPRIATSAPDEFEAMALDVFERTGDGEFYRIVEDSGTRVFRYVSALRLERNCLDCHGEPAGTYDETGFIKEGFSLGDIGGAASITIPLDTYDERARESALAEAMFFCLLLIVVLLVVGGGYYLWVSVPMRRACELLSRENEVKDDFLASMSHELRTPLASVIAFSEILGDSNEIKSEEAKRAVREIGENGTVLLDMVNNTLAAAKLEAGALPVHWEELDVADVVNEVMELVCPLAAKRGISFQKDIEGDIPIVLCDYEILRRVLVNLLGNAAKYSVEHGVVRVTASFAPEGGEGRVGTLVLRVADEGPGLDPEDLERIFDRFERGERHDASSTGSGLGLYLVRNMCEVLGGRVGVDSEIGRGSCFWVELPLQNCEDEDEDSGN